MERAIHNTMMMTRPVTMHQLIWSIDQLSASRGSFFKWITDKHAFDKSTFIAVRNWQNPFRHCSCSWLHCLTYYTSFDAHIYLLFYSFLYSSALCFNYLRVELGLLIYHCNHLWVWGFGAAWWLACGLSGLFSWDVAESVVLRSLERAVA